MSRLRSEVPAAVVAIMRTTLWSMFVSIAILPAAPQVGYPLAATSNSATADPTTITKQPESTEPSSPWVAQIVDHAVIPVSHSNSSNSTITYSSGGQTTVVSLSGDVIFDVGSSALTDHTKQVFDGIVKRWSDKSPATITVVGHAGSIADDAHNQTLPEQRAKAVADCLASKVPPLNVQSFGKEGNKPMASGTNADDSINEADKATNRHVDVRWG